MTQVTLYGKPGCHLCDDARAEVAAVRAERPFELTEVDVSLDPALWRAYGEAFELYVDRAELARVLDTVRP
jgi:glutaredoxin